jgi:Holliday junction resolvase RusA-like endonuclease
VAGASRAKKAVEVMQIGESFECFIPGEPVPWARPIPTKRGGVTPEKQRRHCQMMMLHIRKAWGQKPAIPLGVPVAVEIAFVFASDKKPPGTYKGVKPDVDNLGKIVLDALQGTSHASLVLSNDSQVALQIITKVYGPESGTLIKLRVLQ